VSPLNTWDGSVLPWALAFFSRVVHLSACGVARAGQETAVELEHGKVLYIRLNAVGEVDAHGERDVLFEVRH
jgi:pyruvate carboxylase